MSTVKYWPFDLPVGVELSGQQKNELDFLENCHLSGLRAYMFGAGSFGAENSSGRTGEIIQRGSNRWEYVLAENGESKVRNLTADFIEAKRIVQTWLGKTAGHVLQAG